MQIFVKSLGNKSLTLNVPSDASVRMVSDMIQDTEFLSGFRLMNNGKQLENAGKLSDYGIQNASTLQLLLSVHGGMRAKWRKKRMRRLRRKRRKMRQRAK